MCAPRVTRHTSIRYSSSCHTHINMGASIFFTAAMTRAFRSARSRGNGGTNTRSMTYSQRKKSQAVMSGNLGGHSISGWSFPDARPIQHPDNTVFNQVLTNLTVVVGGTSFLLEYECRYVLQLWLMPQLQRVQICHVINIKGFVSKEKWTVHFLTGDCTKHIDFRTITLMLHIGMWVFRSPYSNTATIYCTADMESRFVTELYLFQEMIIGTH